MTVVVGGGTRTVVVRDPEQSTVATGGPAAAITVDAPDVVVVQGEGARGSQGPAGPSGGDAILATAGATVQAFHPVTIRGDGLAYPADALSTEDATRVAGLAATAALTGEQVTIIAAGEIIGPGPYPVGPLFVASGGGLVPVPPVGGYQLWVAVALTSTRLLVRPHQPILL